MAIDEGLVTQCRFDLRWLARSDVRRTAAQSHSKEFRRFHAKTTEEPSATALRSTEADQASPELLGEEERQSHDRRARSAARRIRGLSALAQGECERAPASEPDGGRHDDQASDATRAAACAPRRPEREARE